MTPAEEKNLVEKAKKDPAAFERLYDEYYSKIFGYVLRRTGDPDASRDVVSTVFVKALRNITRFQWRDFLPGLSKPLFGAWLYRVASHEIANFFRGKKPSVALDQIENSELLSTENILQDIIQAQAVLQDHADFLLIQKKISQLDARYQEVLTLRFFEKKQVGEISKILGKSEGTVKSLLHRGLQRLKKELPPLDV
jgi:RNA polymerase sigma-70 factor (ECF subfamily)